MAKKEAESGKVLAAVSYLWIVGLIVLLTEKKNKFVIFHAKQATALFFMELIALVIPIVGWMVTTVLSIVALYCLVIALREEEIKIPVAYDFGQWLGDLGKK